VLHHIEEDPQVGSPEWVHETVLDSEPPTALARAFVRQHLAGHRLFHLVDTVGAVAVSLTSDRSTRTREPLTLTLSKTGTVVSLTVEDTSGQWAATEAPAEAGDPEYGANRVGLVILHWGVTRHDDEAHWVVGDV
jgi:hypothetical protein